MKKNNIYILYMIILVVTITMLFINGNYTNIDFLRYSDKEIIDGYQGVVSISIINCLILISIWIITIILTIYKHNSLKLKWLCAITIILISLFINIGTDSYSGGVSGTNAKKNVRLVDLFSYINRK